MSLSNRKKEDKKDKLDEILDLDLYGLPYLLSMEASGGGSRLLNPVVFMDISVYTSKKNEQGLVKTLGRIYIELRRDLVPVAAANFLALCIGSIGVGTDGVRYHYKNCKLHRIVKDHFWQCGDLRDENGECSRSIYDGKLFRDENFILRHAGAGCISYCNRGPDTNGSLFQMCFGHNKHLDDVHVVFGCLANDESYEVLAQINKFGSDSGEPLEVLRISDCGVAFDPE